MESSRLSECLQEYLTASTAVQAAQQPEWIQGTLEVVGQFMYGLAVPSAWHLREIERIDHETLLWHWVSTTEEAVCLNCHQVSQRRKKTYWTRRLQDLPCSGMTVYHVVKANRYVCENPACPVDTFTEQFADVAGKDARLTHRLKDFIVQQALDSTANGLTRSLRPVGIRVSRETILRLVKARGATVVAQNLERDDVRVLSVDDINLRKGQPSTACSVFIDGETHRVLVIVQGDSQAIAEKVMRQFPTAEMVSRDRGSAYAAAATALGKPQVADGFHLLQNMHQGVKDTLQQTLGSHAFVRTGSGWVRAVNKAEQAALKPPSGGEAAERGDCLPVVTGPASLTAADREQRIRLAGLTAGQADKYRQTLTVLEMTESGLRTAEIAGRLWCTQTKVRRYRKQAPATVQFVEQRIDEYYRLRQEGPEPSLPETIPGHAQPSSESIVEPYRDTVIRLFQAGQTHRAIHARIGQEGFTGSRNAVYQYVIKYAKEHAIPYRRHKRILSLDERQVDEAPPRPEPIAVERASTTTIYRRLLHLAASQRDAMKQSSTGVESADADRPPEAEPAAAEPEPWVNRTQYADSIAKIVYDTEPKAPTKARSKKLTDATWARLLKAVPDLLALLTCLVAFYEVLISGEVAKLDLFIAAYLHDPREPLATFAAGLQKDYAAVKNCLLYPDISNGPMEATNQKIKMVRRRTYGRAGLELLNGLLAVPWDYYDRSAQAQSQPSGTAA